LSIRRSSLLSTEFIIVFRILPSAMEQLRHELYPFLRPNLSKTNVLGRCNSNHWPLSVDEKVMIGLMVARGCSILGIIWGFGVGHTCAESTAFDFFKAVVESNVGPIEFPFSANELKVLVDVSCHRRHSSLLYWSCFRSRWSCCMYQNARGKQL
jgi:hypothetical protein